MGLVALLKEPALIETQVRLRQQFFDRTGYGPSDILSLNYSTRIFLTRNGGSYMIMENGDVDHLGGPSPDPAERY